MTETPEELAAEREAHAATRLARDDKNILLATALGDLHDEREAHERTKAERDEQHADMMRAEQREGAARAEVERLTAERDEALSAHKHSTSVSAQAVQERDTARARLERLAEAAERLVHVMCIDETDTTSEGARLRTAIEEACRWS